MRINNFISSRGVCSRREADRLIQAGKVLINGVIAQIGMDVGLHDRVLVEGKEIANTPDKVYLLFNKPKGIVTTTDLTKPNNIISFVAYPERIFPVGRLDKDSSGLIILTSDGDIVNRILRSENSHEKEYLVKVAKPLTEAFLKAMASGVEIYNPVRHRYEVTLPARVVKYSDKTFTIVLTQGLNLQIRRMAKAAGNHVETLERVRIMNLTGKGLVPGTWRHLSGEELSVLMEMVAKNP